ncbi:hypothetical protein Gotri_019587 [Gossypium trilobum]|uniref:C-JID domain-containing protein n=1 Tax=Gossypium trilobum TaxID=34281 RepID=A0A7J9EDE8_9ROSI|nr:hypothetical protein [Gossypium trilobum]
MVNVLKDYHQASPQRNKFITCVPGSEIPEWFDFKSLGSSINIQLPSEWWINFPSFVASVVVSFPECYNECLGGITCSSYMMISKFGSLLKVRHQTSVFTMRLPLNSTLFFMGRIRQLAGFSRFEGDQSQQF